MNQEPLIEPDQDKKALRQYESFSRKFKIILGRTILIVAGSMLIFLSVINFRDFQIDKSWKHIQGKVVEVKTVSFDDFKDENEDGRSDMRDTYAPVVEYSVDGKKYRVTSGNGTETPVKVGSSREIAYDPNSPSDAKIVANATLKIGVLAYIPVGVIWLGVAIFPKRFGPIISRLRALRYQGQTQQSSGEAPTSPSPLPQQPIGTAEQSAPIDHSKAI